jgi:hypothetical protein
MAYYNVQIEVKIEMKKTVEVSMPNKEEEVKQAIEKAIHGFSQQIPIDKSLISVTRCVLVDEG